MKMKGKLRKHSLKWISLFLSTFLWAYVLNSEKVRFEKTVSLDYIVPEGMILGQMPPNEVTFLIEGPRAFVRTVSDREDRLVIDLNRSNTNKQLSFFVDVNPTQLNLPFGMIVERVIPRRIPIKLEKKASKVVPLKLQFMGVLPQNVALTKSELRPSEVEVFGPKSLITDLRSLPVKPIDLEGLFDQGVQPVEVFLTDERLGLSSGTVVNFHYQLKASNANLILKDVPIKFLTQSKNFLSSSKTVKVKLFVPETVTKNRSNISSNLQIWADLPASGKGKVKIQLRAVAPPSVHLLEIIPNTIIVNMQ